MAFITMSTPEGIGRVPGLETHAGGCVRFDVSRELESPVLRSIGHNDRGDSSESTFDSDSAGGAAGVRWTRW